MNLDELHDAMSASDPDPGMVRGLFESKRRRRHERYQRLLAASGGLAVVVVLVVGVGVLAHAPSSSSSSSPAGGTAAQAPSASSAPAVAGGAGRAPQAGQQRNGATVPGPSGQFSASNGAGSSGSCAGIPLKQTIADALRHGASVIVATGTLTGKSVTARPATTGEGAFYAMTLSSVQTLRGPAVASGSTAWIPGPAPGESASVTSALLAPGGRLFAIVSPKAATHYLVGPTLRLAPIVGAGVVFTPSDCWDVAALQPSQYQASLPLRSVPDGKPFGGLGQPAENGLYTVPLATIEHVAAQA